MGLNLFLPAYFAFDSMALFSKKVTGASIVSETSFAPVLLFTEPLSLFFLSYFAKSSRAKKQEKLYHADIEPSSSLF